MINWELFCLLFLGVARVIISGNMQEDADLYMQEMKNSEKIDPKTPTRMAYDTLKKAFEKSNPSGMSLMQVLEKVEAFKGPSRYYALRMFEKMDENGDGQITSSEMAFVFDDPTSSAPDALKFMFQIKDLDGNGFVTPWEVVREKMTLEGNVLPISTLWKNALDSIKTDDLDSNGVMDVEEFMLGMVMKTDMAIVHAKRKDNGLNEDGDGMKGARKMVVPKVTLRRAHKKPSQRSRPLEPWEPRIDEPPRSNPTA